MLKVIIADDEVKVCDLVRALVDWSSFDMEIVGVAHNGIEALELVKALNPDIIITDIRMPGHDGLELIRLLKEANPNLRSIIMSGYKQFEYAKIAIKYGVSDYLLKPIKKTELENTLKKLSVEKKSATDNILQNKETLNRLRMGLYTDILFGNKKVSDIKDINKEYHYEFNEGNFQCFAVKVDCPNIELFNNSIKLLSNKIFDITRNSLKGDYYDMEFALKDSIIYCIINYDEQQKDNIRKKLKQIMDELNVLRSMFDKMEFTIGLGEVSEKLFEYSLASTEQLIMQRLTTGTGKIIEDLPEDEPVNRQALLSGFSESIVGVIEVLDSEKLAEETQALKKTILNATSDGQSIYSMVISAYGIYTGLLQNHHQISVGLISDSAEQDNLQFSLCGSADTLFDVLEAKMTDAMTLIIEEKKHESIKPIRIAKQYINANYMNTIALDEVSGIVGFNSSYFSALFKKETGENFLEYVSKIRINKAKEFLKDTNLTIAAICEKVGYQDIAHFTRYFKKYTGLKPNEYRKLYS